MNNTNCKFKIIHAVTDICGNKWVVGVREEDGALEFTSADMDVYCDPLDLVLNRQTAGALAEMLLRYSKTGSIE